MNAGNILPYADKCYVILPWKKLKEFGEQFSFFRGVLREEISLEVHGDSRDV